MLKIDLSIVFSKNCYTFAADFKIQTLLTIKNLNYYE